jgi:hypothetical protein
MRGETAGQGDISDAMAGIVKQAACMQQATLTVIGARRAAEPLLEAALQLAP